MNELSRQVYLDEMGVDVFVPRFILSHAKPSEICDPVYVELHEPEPSSEAQEVSKNDPQSADSIRSESAQSSVPPVAALSRLTGEMQAQKLPPSRTELPSETRQSVNSGEKNSAKLQESIALRLSAWSGQNYFVVDSRPIDPAYPTARLLFNILSRFNLVDSALPNMETIDWPPKMHHGSGSWQEVIDWLLPYCEGKIAGATDKRVFVMGRAAFNAFYGKQEDQVNYLFQCFNFEKFEFQAVVLPSLEDILRQPMLKIEVWKAINQYLNNTLMNVR